ncbi:MAG: exo-alpha-sialidase [Myxococcales bacterium]|nr:exo-alpha-sialidase [Myxococcales bacterium]
MGRARFALPLPLTVAFVLASSTAARANGRYPASNRIVVQPSAPSVVILRATYGLLLSHDAGEHWSWLCEDVLGVPPGSTEDPPVEMTVSGAIVAGSMPAYGLAASPDTGCNWSAANGDLAAQLVKDLAVRPGVAGDVVAVTSTLGPDVSADGGPGYAQQLYESVDDGVTWTARGSPIDPSAIVTTVDLAASAPHRVYASAFRGPLGARSASLFVSDDDGATWVERPVPIDPTRESEVDIGAVDPLNADLVYLRTVGPPSRLLVSNDAGATYTVALSLDDNMLGFAISPDGSKLYAGSAKAGLFVATRDALMFENTSHIHVQCLTATAAGLWACSDPPSGFVAGLSTDDGATFTAKLGLTAPPLISCAADASAAQCAGAPLQTYCAQLGCPAVNAAPTDASVIDGGVIAPVVSVKGCGCAVPGWGPGAAQGALLAGLAGAGLLAGRRRRRAR